MRRIALALFAARLFGQSFGSLTVSGELQHPPSVDPSLLTVELIDPHSHMSVDHQIISSTGDFELHYPAPGTYEVRIVNRDKTVLKSEYATVSTMTGPLSLTLPQPKDVKPPTGSVSVAELRRKPVPKAVKEFKLAQKARDRGKEEETYQHLNAALKSDPDYAPAHSAMSEMLLSKRDYPKAAIEFEEVVRLCPRLPEAHTNLAIALLYLRQFARAEAEAKAALKLAPDNSKARYLMGVSLVGQHRMDPAELRKMSFQ